MIEAPLDGTALDGPPLEAPPLEAPPFEVTGAASDAGLSLASAFD
jgi:hypothetical protein